MGIACDVYTKLLFKRGHGHPLWEPEPTQSGGVLIGDVGYMLDGGFTTASSIQLFPPTTRYTSGTVSRTAMSRSRSLTLCGTTVHMRCKPGQSAAKASLRELGTGTFGPLAHIRFKFSDEQGAVLVLKNDAHREVLHPCRDLTQYILLNHAGWHQFARNVCRLDLKSQDIIFVCGWVKTAEWALAAATHRARDGEIAFGGDFGPAGQASFSVSATKEVSMSWENLSGPKGTQGPGGEEKPEKFDQCVFLHYYKIKHRPFFAPKILRGATEEEHSSRSSSPNGSDHMELKDGDDALSKDVSLESERAEVEMIPHPSEQVDMVDAMLDYILDQTDATCAIVSDRDIAMLSSQQNSGNMPDSLSQLLADTLPNLTVTDGVGMLPNHNIPVDGTTNALPTVPPMVQFVPGPPRVLPQYPFSASRHRRSRSLSQSVIRAMSPSTALAKPCVLVPQDRTLVVAAPHRMQSGSPMSPNYCRIPPLPRRRSSSQTMPRVQYHSLERPRKHMLSVSLTPQSPSGLRPSLTLPAEDDDDDFRLDFGENLEEASPSGAPALQRPSSSSSPSKGQFESGFMAVDLDWDSDAATSLELLPRRRRTRSLSGVDTETSSTVAVRSSPSKGKGKEKEERARKRTRSPSEDGEGGEEDDERPAKRSRKQKA